MELLISFIKITKIVKKNNLYGFNNLCLFVLWVLLTFWGKHCVGCCYSHWSSSTCFVEREGSTAMCFCSLVSVGVFVWCFGPGDHETFTYYCLLLLFVCSLTVNSTLWSGFTTHTGMFRLKTSGENIRFEFGISELVLKYTPSPNITAKTITTTLPVSRKIASFMT